jgi:hypothetical protein
MVQIMVTAVFAIIAFVYLAGVILTLFEHRHLHRV